MNEERLALAIGDIGDDLILEAKQYNSSGYIGRRFAAVAACLVLLICVIYLISCPPTIDIDQPILQATSSTVQPTAIPTAPPSSVPVTQPAAESITQPTLPPIVTPPVASTAAPILPSSIPASTTVLPTGGQEASPIPKLSIDSKEMYKALLASADDATMFAQNQPFIRTFGNQNEVKKFINVLHNLPLPQMDGTQYTNFTYIPRYETFPTGGQISVSMQDAAGNIYSFIYELDEAHAISIRNSYAAQNALISTQWAIPGTTTAQTITNFEFHSAQHRSCWMEIDETMIRLDYKGQAASLDALLAKLSFTRTLPWN